MTQREHQNIQVDSSSDPSGVIASLDELAKGLASGTISRSKALRWMGGALVGAALASIPGVAWAEGGRCSEGQTRCNDRCVNLQNNENHCGSCRNRCDSNQRCCKGRCVNLQRNERHCGSCFNRCEGGEECVGGVCEGEGCPSGTETCGGGVGPPCCPDTCGACEINPDGVFCFDPFQEPPTCESVQHCASTPDCPAGYFCSRFGLPDCPEPFCRPICTGSGGIAVA